MRPYPLLGSIPEERIVRDAPTKLQATRQGRRNLSEPDLAADSAKLPERCDTSTHCPAHACCCSGCVSFARQVPRMRVYPAVSLAGYPESQAPRNRRFFRFDPGGCLGSFQQLTAERRCCQVRRQFGLYWSPPVPSLCPDDSTVVNQSGFISGTESRRVWV